MRNRGIRERKFYLGNPFPAGYTQASLAKAAGFKSLRNFSTQEFFRIVWKYDSEPVGELIVLEPDAIEEGYTPRESEVKEMQFAFRDAALAPIFLEDPRDRLEVLEKSIDRLDRALAEYTRAGTQEIERYQTLNQLDDTRLAASKLEIYTAFINQQVEGILSDRIDLLRGRLEGTAPAAA